MANKEINEIKEGEKVKPIILHDDNGDVYTLEFNLEAVKFAEARGFSLEDLYRKPATGVEDLFYYAFRMHHRNVPRERTNRFLWEDLGGLGNLPDGFIERLGQLYNDPVMAVRAADNEGKNPRLTVEL